MHAQPAAATFNFAPIGTAAATAIGVAIAILVWAAASNSVFPVIGSHDRAALWVVFGLGVTVCAVAGISQTSTSLGWLHPITLVGIALGALAIVPLLLVLFGWTAPLTSAGQHFGGGFATLSVERIAIAGLGLLILVKWVMGFSHYVIRP
jgi:hypothetical protein